jgi:hypothetical protein
VTSHETKRNIVFEQVFAAGSILEDTDIPVAKNNIFILLTGKSVIIDIFFVPG